MNLRDPRLPATRARNDRALDDVPPFRRRGAMVPAGQARVHEPMDVRPLSRADVLPV